MMNDGIAIDHRQVRLRYRHYSITTVKAYSPFRVLVLQTADDDDDDDMMMKVVRRSGSGVGSIRRAE
jgi:hypothetical protein